MTLLDVAPVVISLTTEAKGFCAIDENTLIVLDARGLGTFAVNHDRSDDILEYNLLLESIFAVPNVPLVKMSWLRAANLVLILFGDGKLFQWDPYSTEAPEFVKAGLEVHQWLMFDVQNAQSQTNVALIRKKTLCLASVDSRRLLEKCQTLADLPHTPRAVSMAPLKPVVLIAFSMTDYAIVTTDPLQIQQTINLSSNDVFGTSGRIGASLTNYVTGLGSSRAPPPKLHFINSPYDPSNTFRWAVKTFSEWVELQARDLHGTLTLEENLKSSAPSNGLSALVDPYIVICSNTQSGQTSECRIQVFSQDSMQTLERTSHEFGVVQVIQVPNTHHLLVYGSDKQCRRLVVRKDKQALEGLESRDAYHALSVLGPESNALKYKEIYALQLVDMGSFQRAFSVMVDLKISIEQMIGVYPVEVSSKWHTGTESWRKALRPAANEMPQADVTPKRSARAMSPKGSPLTPEITEGLVRSRSSQFSLATIANAPRSVKSTASNGYEELHNHIKTLIKDRQYENEVLVKTVYARLCVLLGAPITLDTAIDVDDLRGLLLSHDRVVDLTDLLRCAERYDEAVQLMSSNVDILAMILASDPPLDFVFRVFSKISDLSDSLRVFDNKDVTLVRKFLREFDLKLAAAFAESQNIQDCDLAEVYVELMSRDMDFAPKFEKLIRELNANDIGRLFTKATPSIQIMLHARLGQHQEALSKIQDFPARLDYAKANDCHVNLFDMLSLEEKLDLLQEFPFSISFTDALPYIRHVPAHRLKTYLLAQFT